MPQPSAPLETPVRFPKAKSVVLLDDHALVRQGTREMLAQISGLGVVGEFSEAPQLMAYLHQAQEKPDLILLDINLGTVNGLSLIQPVRSGCPHSRVLILSAYAEKQYVKRALSLGACGYLSKTILPEAFTRLVQIARDWQAGDAPILSNDLEGRSVYGTKPDLAADRAVGLPVKQNPQSVGVSSDLLALYPVKHQGLAQLTPRELETLMLVARGMTNKRIADELVVSVKTVDTHVSRLIRKLTVKNRAQLTALAYDQGLL